jgi:hypothetical protein
MRVVKSAGSMFTGSLPREALRRRRVGAACDGTGGERHSQAGGDHGEGKPCGSCSCDDLYAPHLRPI